MRFQPALLLAVTLAIATSLLLTSCGGFTAFGFKSDLPAVSGTVSSVQVSAVSANGGFIQVTFVTLQSSGMSHQFSFCGNNASQFPMNTSVTVHFNPGQNCNVIAVVITG